MSCSSNIIELQGHENLLFSKNLQQTTNASASWVINIFGSFSQKLTMTIKTDYNPKTTKLYI